MQSHIAKPPARSPLYTKFSTPLVLEPPLHCGLPTIRLGLGKHLLGTDNCCTVRVRADNVEPRHAMIIVSEHRTVVKALHPQTWVNEGPVSEMVLRPGDRLSLGPLTFRVRAARADELEDFQAFNAGTFQDEDSFSRDDLMNRNATTEPSWRVGISSGQAHESPPLIAMAPSVFRTMATVAVNEAVAATEIEHLRAEVTAPVDRSLAERSLGVFVPPASGIVEPKVVAPVFHSPVAPVASSFPSVQSVLTETVVGQHTLTESSKEAFGHVAESDHAAGEATASLAPAQQSGASVARLPSTSVSSTPDLDQRLEEISQKLAELNRPVVERSSTFVETAARIDSLAAERRQVIEQQKELRQRADELARQTEQVQAQVARVEEREAETQRLQTQLRHEAEQLRITKDAARRELEEEHARHQILWQEWDTSYRRTSAELNEQLQSLEQRRAVLLADADRLNLERSDRQRMHAELERDRRELAASRSQLSNDHLAVKSLRTEFASERQRHVATMQEREAQVAQERLATSAMQSAVLAARQQLERDRAELMTERVSAASIRERERFELIERREQLDQEQARLQVARAELDSLRRADVAARASFDAERATVPSQPSVATTDDTELARTRERLRQVETELLQSEQRHLATNFVAAPFAAGTLGTGTHGLGSSEAELLRGLAPQNDAAVCEPFADPYADVDLPPLVVGNPRATVVQTGDLSIAEPPAFNALDWESSYGIDSNDRHKPVAGDRFVDPYADVELPPLDLFHQTVAVNEMIAVEEESNELAQFQLDLPDISEWAADPIPAPLSLAVFAADTQTVVAHEQDVVGESESMPLVLSSPDWELPNDEPLNLDVFESDVLQSGESQDGIIPSEEPSDSDVPDERAVVGELELDDIGDDDEYASNASPLNTASISGTSSSSSGSETRSDRFGEDDSLYDTSQSAAEIPVFDSIIERMSDKQSAWRGADPLKVAASLNPEQAIPNDEMEEGLSSGDSVEIWCRSFDTTDAEPAAERDSSEVSDTATATLDESLSIDETLAEVNRAFGVPLPTTVDLEFESSGDSTDEAENATQELFEFVATYAECELVEREQVETEAETESVECGQIERDDALFEFSEVAPDEALQSDLASVEHEADCEDARFADGEAACAESEVLGPEALEIEPLSAESSVREAIDFESESVQSDIPATESTAASLTNDELSVSELTDIEIPVVDFSAIESAFAESCFLKPAVEEFLIPEVTDAETAPEPEIGSACGASVLPAWWKECEFTEIPVYEGPRYADDLAREVAEGLIAAPEDDAPPKQPVAEAPSDPLANLRAQLAQMFDMKTERPANSDEDGSAEAALEVERPDDDLSHDDGSTAQELARNHFPMLTGLPPSPRRGGPGRGEDRRVDLPLFRSSLTLPAEGREQEEKSGSCFGPVPPSDNDSESPEPLGESNSSISDVHVSAVEVHAPQEECETTASAGSAPAERSVTAAATDEEDSVEDYMAQLLSRARGGATVSPQEAKSLAVSATRASAASADPAGEFAAAVEAQVPFDPADRSHLTAGPKHKQDRQAVRDHLQSFRQVAHQSARSALARHTTKHLLSTLIAKTFLLGVSTVAAVFYLGAPLVGWPAEIWNGAACSLAALLSGMEFYRSWSKFRQSFSHGKSPKKKAPRNEIAELPPVPEVASNEVV